MPTSSEDTHSSGSSSSSGDRGVVSRQPRTNDVDLQALAEELYKLLQKEMCLERERRGWRRVW